MTTAPWSSTSNGMVTTMSPGSPSRTCRIPRFDGTADENRCACQRTSRKLAQANDTRLLIAYFFLITRLIALSNLPRFTTRLLPRPIFSRGVGVAGCAFRKFPDCFWHPASLATWHSLVSFLGNDPALVTRCLVYPCPTGTVAHPAGVSFRDPGNSVYVKPRVHISLPRLTSKPKRADNARQMYQNKNTRAFIT